MNYQQAIKEACKRAISAERDYAVVIDTDGEYAVRDSLQCEPDDTPVYIAENSSDSLAIAKAEGK